MLNEKNEVMALLRGERINKKQTYRSCYLLARYFKSIGYDLIKTRESIFIWANKYNIYISDDLNSIIQKAFTNKNVLIDDIQINISKSDINEIARRFDTYNTRLTAFAILCYAKVHADKHRVFCISVNGLSNWIGIIASNLVGKHIKELIDFGFIEKISKSNLIHIKRKNKTISQSIAYKINIPICDSGEYIFKDENIIEEFKNIFSQL